MLDANRVISAEQDVRWPKDEFFFKRLSYRDRADDTIYYIQGWQTVGGDFSVKYNHTNDKPIYLVLFRILEEFAYIIACQDAGLASSQCMWRHRNLLPSTYGDNV